MKIRWLKGTILVIGWMGSLALAAILIGERAERKIQRLRSEWMTSREDESFARSHAFPDVPKAYLLREWSRQYGTGEPDPSTSEGQSRLAAEKTRLPAAQHAFRGLLQTFSEAWNREDDTCVETFLTETRRLLESFTWHENRSDLLRDAQWSRDGYGCLRPDFSKIEISRQAERSLVRCFRVRCTLADWLWIYGGNAYAAAQMDYRCYLMLNECVRIFRKKGWESATNRAESLLDEWRRERCDCADSNFRRAHDFCEEMYQICFAERIRRGEAHLLKLWPDHYRFHLSLARRILKRDPVWGGK